MNKNSIQQSRAKVHHNTGVAPANKQVERNAALFLDHLNGMSSIELCIKYRISSQRIHALIKYIRAEKIKELEAKKNGSK